MLFLYLFIHFMTYQYFVYATTSSNKSYLVDLTLQRGCVHTFVHCLLITAVATVVQVFIQLGFYSLRSQLCHVTKSPAVQAEDSKDKDGEKSADKKDDDKESTKSDKPEGSSKRQREKSVESEVCFLLILLLDG